MTEAQPQKLSGVRAMWLIAAWAVCCLTGFGVLAHYGNTPGEAGAAQPDLSTLEQLALDETRPTVVMFVHPHCPCTAASLESLARLQRRFPDRLALRVVFCVPTGMEADWHEAKLWHHAGRLPSCQRIVDTGGGLCRSAGAATSGTVGVYDPNGRLRFWGGITPSRGHAGDSPGADAIARYLSQQPYDERSDVYGCPLMGCADETCHAPDPHHR